MPVGKGDARVNGAMRDDDHAVTPTAQQSRGKEKRAPDVTAIADTSNLGALTADTAGELDVLGHDGDSLGVDGAQVRVLEQTDEV